jgi:hypothetical protein
MQIDANGNEAYDLNDDQYKVASDYLDKADEYNLSDEMKGLGHSILWTENKFNTGSTQVPGSHAGGPAQMQPATFASVVNQHPEAFSDPTQARLNDVDQNLTAFVLHLKDLDQKHQGNPWKIAAEFKHGDNPETRPFLNQSGVLDITKAPPDVQDYFQDLNRAYPMPLGQIQQGQHPIWNEPKQSYRLPAYEGGEDYMSDPYSTKHIEYGDPEATNLDEHPTPAFVSQAAQASRPPQAPIEQHQSLNDLGQNLLGGAALAGGAKLGAGALQTATEQNNIAKFQNQLDALTRAHTENQYNLQYVQDLNNQHEMQRLQEMNDLKVGNAQRLNNAQTLSADAQNAAKLAHDSYLRPYEEEAIKAGYIKPNQRVTTPLEAIVPDEGLTQGFENEGSLRQVSHNENTARMAAAKQVGMGAGSEAGPIRQEAFPRLAAGLEPSSPSIDRPAIYKPTDLANEDKAQKVKVVNDYLGAKAKAKEDYEKLVNKVTGDDSLINRTKLANTVDQTNLETQHAQSRLQSKAAVDAAKAQAAASAEQLKAGLPPQAKEVSPSFLGTAANSLGKVNQFAHDTIGMIPGARGVLNAAGKMSPFLIGENYALGEQGRKNKDFTQMALGYGGAAANAAELAAMGIGAAGLTAAAAPIEAAAATAGGLAGLGGLAYEYGPQLVRGARDHLSNMFHENITKPVQKTIQTGLGAIQNNR